jgi:hypothetical protein
MNHVQIRVDDWVDKVPENPGEGRAVTVNLMCFWPTTATDAEIQETLHTACENAWTAVRRERAQAV